MKEFKFLLLLQVVHSLDCPGLLSLDRVVNDVSVVCIDAEASMGQMITHEARIEVRCEKTGFDVTQSSEMYSFTDLMEVLMFRDQRSSVDSAVRSQAQYRRTSFASSIWTCPHGRLVSGFETLRGILVSDRKDLCGNRSSKYGELV